MARIERDGDLLSIRTMRTCIELQIRRGFAPELGFTRSGFLCLRPAEARERLAAACQRDRVLPLLLREAVQLANPPDRGTGFIDDDVDWAIDRGRLGVVSVTYLEVVEMSWDRPARSQPDEPPGSKGPARPDEETYFEVRVVDELGEAIGVVPLSLRVGDERTEWPPQPTDGDGRVRIGGVGGSDGWVRVSDLDALRELVRPRWDLVGREPWLEPEADQSTHPLRAERPIEHSLLSETPHTLVIQPWVIRARLLGMYFDTNKCFLLPTARPTMGRLVELYEDNRPATLLVIGHTDTTGEPDYNDPLSLERSESTAAYLTDDVEAWYAWYGDDKPAEKRWGVHEDHLMIAAMAGYSDRPPAEPPVRWHQRTRGLCVDGVAGRDTRRKLIEEYMSLDGTTLPADTELTTHGCGESFPLTDAELSQVTGVTDPADETAKQAHRRVELYFFDRKLGVQPPPPGSISPPNSVEYPEWVRRAQRTHDYPLAPGRLLAIRLHNGRRQLWAHTWCKTSHRGAAATWCLSDEQGWVETTLPPACGEWLLVEWGSTNPEGPFAFQHSIYIDCQTGDGRFDGSDENQKARVRLNNAGYPAGERGLLEDAARAFQADYQVDHVPQPVGLVHGRLPEATRRRLWEIYEQLHCNATLSPRQK